MNLNELREAVDELDKMINMEGNGRYGREYWPISEYRINMLKIVSNLTEDVIRLQGVMPFNKTDSICDDDGFFDRLAISLGRKLVSKRMAEIRNQAIDDCIKAQAGKEIEK